MGTSTKDLKILWALSGGICSFPKCGQELIINNHQDVLGQACHIVAKKRNGPRGEIEINNELIDSKDNLILLCPNHHREVDLIPRKYSVGELIKMKEEHQTRIYNAIQSEENWLLNVSQFYYINAPRLSILLMVNGLDLEYPNLSKFKNLYSMGFDLLPILNQYKSILKSLRINALGLDKLTLDDNQLVGKIFEFHQKFRTKNVPNMDEMENFSLKGQIDKDPIIYKKTEKFKLILTIDPRWFTSTTSFVCFKDSWGDFSGIFMVKRVIQSSKQIIATPFFIGVPNSGIQFDILRDKLF